MKQNLVPFHRTRPRANIMCVDQFANFGGGQRSLLDLLPAFSSQGWSCSVALPGDGPFPQTLRRLGYPTSTFEYANYSSKTKPLWQMLKYALETPKLTDFVTRHVQRHNIDLIYVNGPRMVPPAAWVSWRTGIPLVFHCHNRLLQSSAVALTGQALELASAHVIACCQYAAEPLREYVEPQRLRVVYNGVPDAAVKSRRCHGIKRIGVIGRVEVEKGQLLFVEAAKLVAKQFPDSRFVIVGSPMFSNRTYYSKVVVAAAGLPVEFVDWQDDMVNVYSNLDLLVVPSSTAEATTRVIPEAFSARVPVVAFPAGGIPEVLQDNKTGFLAFGTTAKALAARIISLLRMDAVELETVVEEARYTWERRFTLRAYQDSVCDALSDAMHGFSTFQLTPTRQSVLCR